MAAKNYYISSFFWSTLAKVTASILGFFTLPLLLGLWGKAEYGILSIAASCNGYIQLLDMGMNTGAVRYLSQWKREGKSRLIYSVVHSNNIFYGIIAAVNIIILLLVAIFGENLFHISHEQFQTLRLCLYIICIFSFPTWISSSFYQLIISNMEMAYTQKCYCVIYILRSILIAVTLYFHLSLPVYYFWFTMISAGLLLPYMIHCKRKMYIDKFKIYFNWNDFKVVFNYSLSVFMLSVFQVTASQSRPVVLSIFASDVAETVAEYKIIEVVPSFIISVGLSLSGIFLPKTSQLIASKDINSIRGFAYKGTRKTSVLANILCVPFMLSAENVLAAYVGDEYGKLSVWLGIWCLTALIQIHTSPGNSLVLAYGRTKELVTVTAISCVLSVMINISLAGRLGAGSSVFCYFIYVVIVIGAHYVYYYKKILCLKRRKMFTAFVVPTLLSFASAVPVLIFMNLINLSFLGNGRAAHVVTFGIKTALWLVLYFGALMAFRLIKIKNRRIIVL